MKFVHRENITFNLISQKLIPDIREIWVWIIFFRNVTFLKYKYNIADRVLSKNIEMHRYLPLNLHVYTIFMTFLAIS